MDLSASRKDILGQRDGEDKISRLQAEISRNLSPVETSPPGPTSLSPSGLSRLTVRSNDANRPSTALPGRDTSGRMRLTASSDKAEVKEEYGALQRVSAVLWPLKVCRLYVRNTSNCADPESSMTRSKTTVLVRPARTKKLVYILYRGIRCVYQRTHTHTHTNTQTHTN